MGLKIQRRVTTKARVITTLIAVFAFLVQPMAAMNIPAVFATSGPAVIISDSAELSSAIANQADGQTWTINPGDYAINRNNTIEAGGQTGWYMPITANNITINGVGNPTLFGQEYSANGNWSSQDLVAVFGNDVTINGVTLMPKVDTNKTLEVLGSDFTLVDTIITPNTKVASSVYDNITDASDKAFAQQWGGSIYFSHEGNHRLKNVTVNNAGISFRHAPTGTHIAFDNVAIVNQTSDSFTNSYRYSSAFNNPGNSITGAPQVSYNVNSTLNNLDSVLAGAQNGDTVNLTSDLTVNKQVTITKALTINGNGHTIFSTRNNAIKDTGNNSVLSIQSNGVTVNGLTVDGSAGVYLHGINVFGVSNVRLNQVTAQNNSNAGININASQVVVTDVTTAHNGWYGIDVDKTGASLTVNGTSHHTEANADIYIDDTNKVAAITDNSHQYSSKHVGINPRDLMYKLTLAAPTNPYPADLGFMNTNDFWFKWNQVANAVSYEWQGSQSGATNPDGTLQNVTWTGDYQKVQPTNPTAHSVGASGTWYWQVRAVDAFGLKGVWSPAWSVTVDTTKPDAPSGLSWVDSNNKPVLNNGFTNVQKGTLSWKTTTPSDVDHYVYKFWTNIAGYQDDASHPWSDSYSYVVKDIDGGHVPTDFADKQGTYFFCVEAVDKAGNNSGCSSTFAVTYDASAPVATITSPSAGLVHGVVTVSGTVADTNPDHYYFVVKNSSGTVVAGPGTVNQAQVANWSWDTTKSKDGVYTIDLEARDKANNKDANSVATLQVTVDNTAPTVKITSSTQNTDGSWTFKGTTDDTAPVDVTISGVTKPYDAVLSNGIWSVTTGTDLTVGLHTATASSTDSTGNSSKVSSDNQVPFTIVVHSPALLLTVPSQLTTAPTATPGTLAGSFNTVGSATAPAADPAAVLGAQTAKDNSAVLGTSDKVAAIAPSTQGWKIFGVAWYWWALIIAAIAAIMWWIIAAARRRNQNA